MTPLRLCVSCYWPGDLHTGQLPRPASPGLPARAWRSCAAWGSLTTPPCAEIVEWLVLTDPIAVAEADVATFAKLYPLNARPVQKDNRRYVLQSS